MTNEAKFVHDYVGEHMQIEVGDIVRIRHSVQPEDEPYAEEFNECRTSEYLGKVILIEPESDRSISCDFPINNEWRFDEDELAAIDIEKLTDDFILSEIAYTEPDKPAEAEQPAAAPQADSEPTLRQRYDNYKRFAWAGSATALGYPEWLEARVDELHQILDSLEGNLEKVKRDREAQVQLIIQRDARIAELSAKNERLAAALTPFAKAGSISVIQNAELNTVLLIKMDDGYHGIKASDFGAILDAAHLRAAAKVMARARLTNAPDDSA